jgi:hypothetical protein
MASGALMDDEEDLTEEQLEDLAAIRKRKKQIVINHRIKKGSANNQAVLPRRAQAERTLTTEGMKVRQKRCMRVGGGRVEARGMSMFDGRGWIGSGNCLTSLGCKTPAYRKPFLSSRFLSIAQKSLGAMGIDTSKAIERVRSESRGRKRERSASRAAEGDAEMEDGEPKKRLHSSKSRTMSRGRSLSVAGPKAVSGTGLPQTSNVLANLRLKNFIAFLSSPPAFLLSSTPLLSPYSFSELGPQGCGHGQQGHQDGGQGSVAQEQDGQVGRGRQGHPDEDAQASVQREDEVNWQARPAMSARRARKCGTRPPIARMAPLHWDCVRARGRRAVSAAVLCVLFYLPLDIPSSVSPSSRLCVLCFSMRLCPGVWGAKSSKSCRVLARRTPIASRASRSACRAASPSKWREEGGWARGWAGWLNWQRLTPGCPGSGRRLSKHGSSKLSRDAVNRVFIQLHKPLGRREKGDRTASVARAKNTELGGPQKPHPNC